MLKRIYMILVEIIQRYTQVISGYFTLLWYVYRKYEDAECVYVQKKLPKGMTIKISTVNSADVFYDTTTEGYKIYYPKDRVKFHLKSNGIDCIYSEYWILRRKLRHILALLFIIVFLGLIAYFGEITIEKLIRRKK